MSVHVLEMSDLQISSIVADINQQGYAVIPNFVSDVDLAKMRAFAAESLSESKGEYVGFTGPGSVLGSGLDELAASLPFRDMIERIYEKGTGEKAPDQEFHLVLRCLSGKSALKHSYLFHYDSYVITALLPIEIPGSGLAGDFLMFPNTRRVRKKYLANVIDKLILDNSATQWGLRKLTTTGLVNLTRVRLTPGNIYFFWGYRSIHTNEPCDPDQVRATALFHYARPHLKSSFVTMAKSLIS